MIGEGESPGRVMVVYGLGVRNTVSSEIKVMGRKPHIKLPCEILGIIHAYSPDSISWGFKTDKNKLFACACLNQLVINCNDRGF